MPTASISDIVETPGRASASDIVSTPTGANQNPPAKSWMDQLHDLSNEVESANPLRGFQEHPVTSLLRLVAGPAGQFAESIPPAVKSHVKQAQAAASDFQTGDYATGVGHAAAAAIPLMGPAAAEAGSEIGRGEYLKGLTHAALILAPFAVRGAPAIAEGAGKAATAVKAAAPDVGVGAAKIAGGELIGQIPGMEWPGRIALGYPGIRQIANGIKKGIQAARAAGSDIPAATEDEALLEGLSQSQLGKTFARATEEEKASIRQLADRVNGAPPPGSPASSPSPATPNPPANQVPATSAPSLTTAQRLEAELSSRRSLAPVSGGGNAAPGAAIGGAPAPIGVNVPLRPPIASVAPQAPAPVAIPAEEVPTVLSKKLLTKQEMLDKGADGYLSYAVHESIPVDSVVGREPTPSMEGSYPGRPITQPIEVTFDPEQGYILNAGNHRITQAEMNGDKTIPAYVEYPTKLQALKRINGKYQPTVTPPVRAPPEAPFKLDQATMALANRLPGNVRPPIPRARVR